MPEHLWRNQANGIHINKSELKPLKAKLEAKITELYFEKEYGAINDKSKLCNYKKFKTNFSQENYVNIPDVPLAWRKLYCSFRLSAHDLEIERGRYSRPYVPVENRICKLCNVTTESDDHFMLNCTEFNEHRETLFTKIDRLDPNFLELNDDDRFKYLMTNTNNTITIHVMEFIYLAYRKRKCKLSSGQ